MLRALGLIRLVVWDQANAVVGSHCGVGVFSQGVKQTDCVCRVHRLSNILRGPPFDPLGFVRGSKRSSDYTCSEHDGDHSTHHILVHAGKPGQLDVKARFFSDLAGHSLRDGLNHLEYPTGRFPSAVVAPLDHQNSAGVVHHRSCHGN